jgi:site-specific DNA recombinase
MNPYFAYIRVSDPRQGRGVSLDVQEAAIKGLAARDGITIVEWFRELETAAKQGRGVFSAMLQKLKRGEAHGVIFHKIDRSARNLDDWSNVVKLLERGIDVRFAHDNIDLHTRGGRLSADIQAVVAADFIRNHREEVKKGFYGRLKQGVYPLPAPVGYLNAGAGHAKELDPVKAPLIRKAFELYASNRYSLQTLRAELGKLGLRSRSNKPLSMAGTWLMLRNPFYIGLIRIKTTGEMFQGAHTPLISKAVFDRVQIVLSGKVAPRSKKHDFLYRMRISCKECGRHLTGERRKQRFVYYRCHGCGNTIVPERLLNEAVQTAVSQVRCQPSEMQDLGDLVEEDLAISTAQAADCEASLKLRIAKCDDRLARLTDALIDQLIDKESFEARKGRLLNERRALLDEQQGANGVSPLAKVHEKFGLINSLILGYELAVDGERREIMDNLCSDFSAQGKNVAISLYSPYREIRNLSNAARSGPYRNDVRTRARKLFDILKSCAARQEKDTMRDKRAA